jgi:hypothetical protein
MMEGKDPRLDLEPEPDLNPCLIPFHPDPQTLTSILKKLHSYIYWLPNQNFSIPDPIFRVEKTRKLGSMSKNSHSEKF